jgi:hypothetical protein
MKRVEGTLLQCVQQATKLEGLRTKEEQVASPVLCRLQGSLLTILYLMPGESEGILLKDLGQAISNQAKVSSAPVAQEPAFLEYDETLLGELDDDQLILGKLYLRTQSQPVAFIYQQTSAQQA